MAAVDEHAAHHVVVIGAGPAGLLLAYSLVQQAAVSGAPWRVTLVDDGDAPVPQDADEDALSHRDAQPILLTQHGIAALGPALLADIEKVCRARWREYSIPDPAAQQDGA